MNRRLPFITLLALLIAQLAQAQFLYNFREVSAPYAPLTGGTLVNGNTIWDNNSYSIPMPFSWKLDSTIVLSTLELYQKTGLPLIVDQTTNTRNQSGFMLCDAGLIDRGDLSKTGSRSPIRHQTIGTAPFRIFKLELFNTGFEWEKSDYLSLDDSFNLQLWIFETTNIIELHYGPSKITHPGKYYAFSSGNGPIVGFLKHYNMNSGSGGNIYFLNGTTPQITIDSLHPSDRSFNSWLNSWPSDGTVFRFIPKSVICPQVTPNFSSQSRGINTAEFVYTGTTAGVDSLVWDFGDGGSQSVSSNLGATVRHTYAAAGSYNVTVTAHTICENPSMSAMAAPVAVGAIEPDAARIFPSPAGNTLQVEGLPAGTTAVVYSAQGQLLLQAILRNSPASIDISALPQGSYYLQLRNASGSGSHRFTKL